MYDRPWRASDTHEEVSKLEGRNDEAVVLFLELSGFASDEFLKGHSERNRREMLGMGAYEMDEGGTHL